MAGKGRPRTERQLAGVRFGMLVVTRRAHDDVRGKPQWFCDCDCGRKDVPRLERCLIHRGTRSCGCMRSANGKRVMQIIRRKSRSSELVGLKFNLLTIRAEAGRDSTNKPQFFCDCDCGETSLVMRGSSVVNGESKSCGCLRRKNGPMMWKVMHQRTSVGNHA